MMKKVLIISDSNNCRCQMLEGWLNYYGKGAAKIESAGTVPAGKIDLRAVKVMMDAVIDISTYKPKGFEMLTESSYDYLFYFDSLLLDQLPEELNFKTSIRVEAAISESSTGDENDLLRAYAAVRDFLEDFAFDFTNQYLKPLF